MAAILRIFPAKRRKTESESVAAAHHDPTSSGVGLFAPNSSTVSLSTLLAAPSSSSSASSSASSSSSTSSSSHRRQMSAGSFKPGLPPVAPRGGVAAATRRRESNNNNNNHLRSHSGVSTSSNIPDICTQSNALLEPDNIRMVLIDVDSKCLYDTTTVIPIRKNSAAVAAAMMKNAKNLSNCKQFELLKRRKDTRMLSQLLFGAVPTESGSDSFKIHILDDEEKILVSKTFYMPKPDRNQRTISETQTGSSDSDSQTTIKTLQFNKPGDVKNRGNGDKTGDDKDQPLTYFARHTPLTRSTTATPEQFTRVRHVSMNLGDDDVAADCSTTMSSSSSVAAASSTAATLPRAFSPPHRLSRNRRRQMAAKTSLSENGAQGFKSRSRFSSINSSQTEDDHGNARHVALGILFPAAQRHFLFQHMPLIEAEMSRFESRMITIGQNPPSFFINTHNAWNDFVQTVCCLHNAPRLRNPVWLSLNEHVDEEKLIAKQFCDQLAYLLNKYETKESGFFISKLVSTILMHHMSWVASVASPPVRNDPRLRESSSMLFGMTTNEDAHALGYNAHMAQYLELSGSCGPHRSAKTVLVGDDADLLATLCQVLSFFIRCSAVQHVEEEKVGAMLLELPIEQAFSPIDDVVVLEKLATSPIDIPSPPTEEKSSDDDTIRKLYQHQRRKLRREAAASSQAAAVSLPALLGSPSSSVDSLPSVVTQTTSICVIADDTASSITIIDRIEYPPCCDHHSTTDDEETTGNNGGGGPNGGGSGSRTDLWSPRPSSDGLGRSLFAGPLTTYCPHFVVSSIVKNRSNWSEVVMKMEEEMRSAEDEQATTHRGLTSNATPAPAASSSSSTTTTTSPYEVQLPENILIVGDINDWSVRVLSSAGCDVVDMPPEAVVSMFEQFMDLYNARLDLGTDFLLSTIEDALAQIVGKSFTLVEMVARDDETLELTPERVRSIVGCDHSDLRLIVNVAAVYCPPVLSSVFG